MRIHIVVKIKYLFFTNKSHPNLRQKNYTSTEKKPKKHLKGSWKVKKKANALILINVKLSKPQDFFSINHP